MVTIIVIAHLEIANSLVSCAEHILAKRVVNLHVIPVRKTEDVEHVLNRAEEFISRQSDERQILLLTDLFGATPSNIASKLIRPGKIEMITGLNMPMLLRAISYTEYDLQTCVEKAIEGGKNGILHLNGDNVS
ncbi:MAG TPA: PTS sugar transporter subunit IIA [Aquella sp.]|nr:PTS sugar transporter subunit IIA [Aquella sp.]